MAAWREEDHPRDERGRFASKGALAAHQIGRTVASPTTASDEALLDVFVRVAGKAKLSPRDEAALVALDAEMQRRDAGGEREPTAQERAVDDLVGAGRSYEEAYREVYGDLGADDSDRRRGESREQARRRQYAELTALAVLQAESATRGNLLAKSAAAAGVDPVSIFSGPRARARKHASEELLRWWEDHPRITYAEYRADQLGDAAGGRRARAARKQASNGRDFAA
ncbi:hypothetical protein C5N14_30860 [Micromonospora sp. MW-13]|uniref:hypothetical protein n=1 Tax=Micromonospora sp. MW-13 TaxID=2094022 RepID=UPI000E44336B|nr:hypothetical protein [Micromonospora sp. MW-13]RGC64994.1 hypothetical protein C5N14_30860 [Micromonospora sp. MW-13]